MYATECSYASNNEENFIIVKQGLLTAKREGYKR